VRYAARPSHVLLLLLLSAAAAACKGSAPLPPKAVALNAAGTEALQRGDLETAGARFALALEYHPRFVEALVNQGLVSLKLGNLRRARQLFERAKRLNPDMAQPYHALGVLAEHEGHPDEASAHYREALRVDPGFFVARANLARLYFDAGYAYEALLESRRLVEVAPEQPAGHAALIESLLQLGRRLEADAALDHAISRFPEDGALQILAARKELRERQFDAAIARLRPLASRRDDLAAAALSWMATGELAAGKPRRALGAAQKALDLVPDDAVASYVVAASLVVLNNPSAKDWILRALELGSTLPSHASRPRSR
jgi:tetratricopeptide (TPR) repeat protein